MDTVKTYLLRRGVAMDCVFKIPEAAAELARVEFLQENYLRARHELRGYIVLVVAAPVTAPMLYLLRPAVLMLFCSVGFAAIVVCTCIRQIVRRRQTMKDYIVGMERLIYLAQKHEPK